MRDSIDVFNLALSDLEESHERPSNNVGESLDVKDIEACLDSSQTFSKLELSDITNKKN